jgi:hypothetical protein
MGAPPEFTEVCPYPGLLAFTREQSHPQPIGNAVAADTANVLTRARWRTYVPELPYAPPCGG